MMDPLNISRFSQFNNSSSIPSVRQSPSEPGCSELANPKDCPNFSPPFSYVTNHNINILTRKPTIITSIAPCQSDSPSSIYSNSLDTQQTSPYGLASLVTTVTHHGPQQTSTHDLSSHLADLTPHPHFTTPHRLPSQVTSLTQQTSFIGQSSYPGTPFGLSSHVTPVTAVTRHGTQQTRCSSMSSHVTTISMTHQSHQQTNSSGGGENPMLKLSSKTFEPNKETGRAEVPTDREEVPTGQAELPTGQVVVPTGLAEVLTGQTEFTTGQPEVPISQAEVLTGQTEVPTNQAEVPTGEGRVLPILSLIRISNRYMF